jgi:hypothetical protein
VEDCGNFLRAAHVLNGDWPACGAPLPKKQASRLKIEQIRVSLPVLARRLFLPSTEGKPACMNC